MKKTFKALAAMACLLLALSAAQAVYADESAAEERSVATVYVRIEGNGETLLPQKAYSIGIGGEPVTALMALEAAVGEDYAVSVSEYGAMITDIMGSADDGALSWMYSVNNTTPWVSVDQCGIKNGDSLVFYFISWKDAAYSYFKPGRVSVMAGEPFTLTLFGSDFMEGEVPVAGAQIAITSNAPLPRLLYYTDENGQVKLSFDFPGIYEIGAYKIGEDGVNLISKPYCAVRVTPYTAFLGLPDFDLSAIKPAPMPLVTVPIFANEEGTIFVYDKVVDAEGLKSFIQDGEVMLPFRVVAEALGASVFWDAGNGMVTARYGDLTISFSSSGTLGGAQVRIVGDRVFVPQSYIVQQFQLEPIVGLSE